MSNGYDINRLPYPLSFRTRLIAGLAYNADAVNPSPSDCSWFVLQLSHDERLKLTSAMQAGLDQIYPDEYVDLFQLWLQATNYPNRFPPSNGGNCMPIDLCSLILECIETTPELQQAIGSYSLTSSITDTTPENPSNLATDILLGQGAVSCDNDNLYGASLQLTQLLNTVSENLLDIFVNGFNNASNLATVIEAIPVVGELPFDDILDFLEKVAIQINTAYQSAYDTQLEEDISCLFFCETQANCELTFEQARDVIKAELATTVSVQDFASIINDMIANNWFGQQSVYVFFYFILETVILGGEILGLDVNRFAKTVATYFNDPNPDWSTLCDCAFDWQYTLLDGSNVDPSVDGWTIPYGAYDAVDDVVVGEKFTQTNIAMIRFDFDSAYDINYIKMRYDVTQIENGRNQVIEFRDDQGVVQYNEVISVDYPPENQTDTLLFDEAVTVANGWYLRIFSQATEGSPGDGQAILSAVVIRGTGTNPF